MQTAKVNGKKIVFPTSWEKVKRDKPLLVYLVSLFFMGYNKQQIRLMAALRMLKVHWLTRMRVMSVIEKYPKSKIAQGLCEKLFLASLEMAFVTDKELKITENLFLELYPALKPPFVPPIGRRWLRKLFFTPFYGPENVLRDFSVWEFALAEQAACDYAKANNIDDLNRLIAIIYRKKSKTANGKDLREKFKDSAIAGRLSFAAKIPIAIKYLVYLWFIHERNEIIKLHPHVYNRKKSAQNKENGTWADTILSLAQVGDEEKVSQLPLAIVLKRIENSNKYFDELNSKMKIKN